MSVEMNYIIDSLDEIVGNEKSVKTEKDLSSCIRIIDIGCNAVSESLYMFDVESRTRILNDLLNVLAKSRFASMLVYSRYKGFPGLDGLFTFTRSRMLNMDGLDGLEGLERYFYNKNIDNDMSDSKYRFIMYSRTIINDKLDYTYDLHVSKYSRLLIELKRMYPNFLSILNYLRDSVETDMIEYIDMNHIIGQYDELLDNNLESFISDTEDILLSAISSTINSLYEYIRTESTDDNILDILKSCGERYIYIVNSYGGNITKVEMDGFIDQLTKACIEVCIKSTFRRSVEILSRCVLDDGLNDTLKSTIKLLILIAEI